MKFLFAPLLFFFTLTANAQNADNLGFTNKAEAKNQMLNGKKDGKWVELYRTWGVIITDTNAPYYMLSIYKAGSRVGMVRVYHRSGKLYCEIPYANGERNGVEKTYYSDGKLQWETAYANDKENGDAKEYYENGKVKSLTSFTDDKAGVTKNYDKKGKEIK